MNSTKFNKMMGCIDAAKLSMEAALEGGVCVAELASIHENIQSLQKELFRCLGNLQEIKLSSELQSQKAEQQWEAFPVSGAVSVG